MKKLLLVVALVLALAPLAWSAEKIAVIPKGTTHNFWKSIESGARKAGKELGVDIIWKGPMKEDDRAQQISIVQQFVSSGISAIVLAPLDDTALRGPVIPTGLPRSPSAWTQGSSASCRGFPTRPSPRASWRRAPAFRSLP